MKNLVLKTCLHICLFSSLLVQVSGAIALSNQKGVVLPAAEREAVLDACERYLGNETNTRLSSDIEESTSLFAGHEKVEEVEIVQQEVVKEEVNVVYDDASVLKVVAANLSKQVRGTLARGSSHYLQLQGGQLVKEGTSFPARLPNDKDKTYNITLIKVLDTEYTLGLGEETLKQYLEKQSPNGVRALSVDP